jgi:hypothetical protein
MNHPLRFLGLAFLVVSAFVSACSKPAADSHAHAGFPTSDGVYFITPTNGATVTSPVVVRFGLKGKGVAPAGQPIPNTGHHHLLVDVATLPPLTAPLPSDDKHRHFGAGQTEASIELPPGQHTLQLVVGDHLHVPLGQAWVSEKITITVK